MGGRVETIRQGPQPLASYLREPSRGVTGQNSCNVAALRYQLLRPPSTLCQVWLAGEAKGKPGEIPIPSKALEALLSQSTKSAG